MRALSQAQDVEDAFQATFVVLSRKAATIREPGSVSSWLHGVACRIAKQIKTAGSRGTLVLRPETAAAENDPLLELAWRELRVVLDDELQRLPGRYRDPLLLCYLEGRTQDEAARQMGWSKRTLRRRLGRGRELLRLRLTRRGLTLPAALCGTLLTPTRVLSALPVDLAEATARAALMTTGGVGAASLRATTLADALLRALLVARVRTGVLVLLILMIAATGAGIWVRPLWTALPSDQVGVPVTSLPPPANANPEVHLDAHGDPLPDGAQARLGTIRLRAGYPIYNVAFGADGTTLGAGSDGCVRLWQTATGKTVVNLDAPWSRIHSVAFAPDGKTLAAGGLGPTIRLWDLKTGGSIRDVASSSGNVSHLLFSADSRTLVWGSADGTIHLWDRVTGRECGRLAPPALRNPHNLAWPVAVLPDNRIATRDMNSRLRIWDVGSGKEALQLDWLPQQTPAVALAPDGAVVAAAERDNPTIRLWKSDSKEELRQLRSPTRLSICWSSAWLTRWRRTNAPWTLPMPRPWRSGPPACR
jgi:RNA polymerase sigma factor (sigma-70 family)